MTAIFVWRREAFDYPRMPALARTRSPYSQLLTQELGTQMDDRTHRSQGSAFAGVDRPSRHPGSTPVRPVTRGDRRSPATLNARL